MNAGLGGFSEGVAEPTSAEPLDTHEPATGLDVVTNEARHARTLGAMEVRRDCLVRSWVLPESLEPLTMISISADRLGSFISVSLDFHLIWADLELGGDRSTGGFGNRGRPIAAKVEPRHLGHLSSLDPDSITRPLASLDGLAAGAHRFNAFLGHEPDCGVEVVAGN